MSNLITDLIGNVSEDVFSKVSQKAKIPSENGLDLGKKAFSLFTAGAAGNISKDKKEAEKIIKTLDQNHQGDFDLKNILAGQGDGEKILKHLFGNKENNILENFVKEENLEKKQASSLLGMLAPVFMNSLVISKNKINANSDVLGQLITMAGEVLVKNNSKGNNSILNSLLDKNKNGSIWDEVFNMIVKFIKKNK